MNPVESHLADDIVAEIEGATHDPSPLSMVGIWALGGAMSRVGTEETSVGRRDARFLVEMLANWQEPKDTEQNVAWVRDVFASPQFSSGRPNFNFPGLAEDTEAFVHSVFGSQYQRLVAAKREYDPTNCVSVDPERDIAVHGLLGRPQVFAAKTWFAIDPVDTFREADTMSRVEPGEPERRARFRFTSGFMTGAVRLVLDCERPDDLRFAQAFRQPGAGRRRRNHVCYSGPHQQSRCCTCSG